MVRPFTNIEVNNATMPVDLMSLVDNIPEATSVVFNQIIYLPSQKQEVSKLGKKKNRHASLPNPSNQIAVEDIKQVEELIARENKQLVYCHFNLIVTVKAGADLQNAPTIWRMLSVRLASISAREPTISWSSLSTHSLATATA